MTDHVVGLRIAPLDVLFFRDGRSFGPASTAESALPQPQTLAGALRTHLLNVVGCDFDALAAAIKGGQDFAEAAAAQSEAVGAIAALRFRGPWLFRDGKPLVPVPATLLSKEETGEIIRLDPLQDDLPGWAPSEEGMRPLWTVARGTRKRCQGYLTFNGLARFLDRRRLEPSDIIPAGELYNLDRRTGIAVDRQSAAAQEGMIYTIALLSLRAEVEFYTEVVGQTASFDQLFAAPFVMAFGGEGRRVAVARTSVPIDWPEVKAEPASGSCSLLLLTTAAPFGGWKPSWMKPVAAAVSDHVAVSGWDLARGGPKPNRFAVAAGAVYFLDNLPRDRAYTRSLCAEADARLGWGHFLIGAWHHV